MVTLIMTARLNDADPFGGLTWRRWRHGPASPWLADAFTRIAAHPQNRIDELPPWNWKRRTEQTAPAQAA